MPDVFVSYASEDREAVRKIVELLRSEGWSIWWDRQVVPGARYDLEIEEAIGNARCVVVVWSTLSTISDWVRWEAHEGLRRRVLVPVRIDGASPPGDMLRVQSVDLRAFLDGRPDPDQQAGNLLAAVREITQRSTSAASNDDATLPDRPKPSDTTQLLTAQHGMGSDYQSRPSIAVMPFRCSDPAQDYFVDGIAEGLIASLSMWRSFPVIAYVATLPYKNKAIDARQIAADLGVGYIVSGSLRRNGDSSRVTAELSAAATGQQVWTKRWDGDLAKMFDLQDQLSEEIVVQIEPTLLEIERRQAERKRPSDMTAWDLGLRAHWHWSKHTRDDNARARDLAKRALELDPQSVFATVTMAKTHYVDIFYGWSPDLFDSLKQYNAASVRGVELGFDDPSAHVQLGMARMLHRQSGAAINALEQAVVLNPSLPLARMMLGQLLMLDDRAAEGVDHVQKALRLMPKVPTVWGEHGALALGYFVLGDYPQAIEWARTCINLRPGFKLAHTIAAASAVLSGNPDDGRRFIEDLKAVDPDPKLHDVVFVMTGAKEHIRRRFFDALAQVGVDPDTRTLV